MVAVVLLVALAAIVAGLVWYVRRSSPPPVADDLRRADEAEQPVEPGGESAADRISDAFGETEPAD
jgi:uncharacterized membrane protein